MEFDSTRESKLRLITKVRVPRVASLKNPRRAYEDSSRQLHPGLPSL